MNEHNLSFSNDAIVPDTQFHIRFIICTAFDTFCLYRLLGTATSFLDLQPQQPKMAKKHVCEHCNASFSKKPDMQAHVRKMECIPLIAIPLPWAQDVVFVRNSDELFWCPIPSCTYTNQSGKTFRIHITRNHHTLAAVGHLPNFEVDLAKNLKTMAALVQPNHAVSRALPLEQSSRLIFLSGCSDIPGRPPASPSFTLLSSRVL